MDSKNGVNHYGYKNNICIDVEHGFIRRYAVTPANIHDSQMLPMLLDPENTDDYVWAAAITHLVEQPNSVIVFNQQSELVLNMFLAV